MPRIGYFGAPQQRCGAPDVRPDSNGAVTPAISDALHQHSALSGLEMKITSVTHTVWVVYAHAAVREAPARGGAEGAPVEWGPASVRGVAVSHWISGGISAAGRGGVLINASLTHPSPVRSARYESQARSNPRVVEWWR